LTTPAAPSALVRIRRAVDSWLADQRIGREAGWEIVAACHEACANAAEHAYPPSLSGSIAIEGRLENGRVVMSVHDRGRWRPSRGRNRGRGFTLMEHFMDKVDIERSEDGTTIRMERTVDRGEGA